MFEGPGALPFCWGRAGHFRGWEGYFEGYALEVLLYLVVFVTQTMLLQPRMGFCAGAAVRAEAGCVAGCCERRRECACGANRRPPLTAANTLQTCAGGSGGALAGV
jgi:hypothetical protein